MVRGPKPNVQRPKSDVAKSEEGVPSEAADIWLASAGSRRRSGAQAGVARLGKSRRLSMRNVASAHQVLREYGAAEEGTSELLVEGGRTSASSVEPSSDRV